MLQGGETNHSSPVFFFTLFYMSFKVTSSSSSQALFKFKLELYYSYLFWGEFMSL
jgi:hypothetical protein